MKSNKLSLLYIALTVLIMLALIPKYAYNDPDTFWHIEVGRYMLSHHQILHHAIHTFYQDKLPYVPHEFGFQLIVAPLYRLAGWPGLYLLAAGCLFLLIQGLLRLTRVSRKELGLSENNALLLPFVLIIASWIYYNYFKMRPQMISSVFIVWFFVYLREFQMVTKGKYATALIILSCAIANFHAGVWLVVAVFTGMAGLEAMLKRQFNRRRILVFLGICLAGLLNPGGPKSLFYIFTVTRHHFNLLINEWQPLQFGGLENLPVLLLLLFFVLTLPFTLHRIPFRYMLAGGILYLGVSNFKQNLFMWLFIPYFAAALLEALPRPFLRNFQFQIGRRALTIGIAIGLLLNTAYIFLSPPQVDAKDYPVDEMDYILQHQEANVRPKVMARYGASGYVMFRGGDVLCDGRQDPFVTDASRGALGWTAFERSIFGFSEYLPEIVAADQPDYLIVQGNVSWKLLDQWKQQFGQPVYKGRYGSVFYFKPH